MEVAAKAAATFLAMEIFGLGFSGGFIAGLVIAVASTVWCRRVLCSLLDMVQFLAYRLALIPDDRLQASIRTLWRHGLPAAISVGCLLFLSYEDLGRLYGQRGPWWSTPIEALAISFPLRYATNVTRAALQSRGGFATVAALDSVAFWLLATPLVAIGLYFDSPVIAYLSLSLFFPEAACAARLWKRFWPVSRIGHRRSEQLHG